MESKMLKVKITMSTEDKTVSRTFTTENPVVMSDEDAFINASVSKVLEDFDKAPKKIKVVATLVM